MSSIVASLPHGTWQAAVGGVVLGSTTTAMLAATGKLIGLSGILDGAFSTASGQRWKVVFLSGLTIGSIAGGIAYPDGVDQTGAPTLSTMGFIVSGFLVGLGTRLSNGCTSGHGLCGLPRLSRRSLAATLTFLTSGVATAGAMAAFASGGVSESEAASPVISNVALGTAVASLVATMSKKVERVRWRAHLSSLACGATFAAGLVLSGMVKRAKVMNFLALRPDSWDPSLMFVLGCGVLPSVVGFPMVIRALRTPACRTPAAEVEPCSGGDATFGDKFEIPTNTELDIPLILGSWIFGVGWGIGGMCPGPALIAAVIGQPSAALYFFPSMLAGMKLAAPLKTAISLPHPHWVTGGSKPNQE